MKNYLYRLVSKLFRSNIDQEIFLSYADGYNDAMSEAAVAKVTKVKKAVKLKRGKPSSIKGRDY